MKMIQRGVKETFRFFANSQTTSDQQWSNQRCYAKFISEMRCRGFVDVRKDPAHA
jgi:hypothetical protein